MRIAPPGGPVLYWDRRTVEIRGCAMEYETFFTKYISILYRQSNRYYDRELAKYGIGYGQQFFLPRIYEHQGLSMYDLARLGYFDKGTVTKAVQKLEEQGYIRSETDRNDKRIRRLYTTEEALPLIDRVYQVRRQWHKALIKGMPEEAIGRAETLLAAMAQNAFDAVEEQDQARNE